MAGHSKWSKVGLIADGRDARRGNIFSKCSHEINGAPGTGGGEAMNAPLCPVVPAAGGMTAA